MYLIKIYFILGLAMLLVVLWDFKKLPKTARLLTKPPAEHVSGFALIANAIRNMVLMALFAFFLWPLVVVIEVIGDKEK